MKGQTKPIIVVQGGQYGSEAKGLITAKLVADRKVDVAIRTGTVNAGHTVYYNGRPYAMQQLPVAWVRPECKLVLGPGAYIHPEILAREIGWINEVMPGDVRDRLYIDRGCGLHLPLHTDRSTASGRHHKMGATGKGSSEAVMDKIRFRGDRLPLYREWSEIAPNHSKPLVCDTVAIVNDWYDAGEQLLIEGTQGTLLDIHLGEYPYTTHKQTQAANWMAEAGLSCTLPVELVSVMRTHPIRVAGNSGPLPEETSWVGLARTINRQLTGQGQSPRILAATLINWENAVIKEMRAAGLPQPDPSFLTQAQREAYPEAVSEVHARAFQQISDFDRRELAKLFETTTVTKKLRRIANWSAEDAKRSVMLNRPTSVALTFVNYVFPELWGCTEERWFNLSAEKRLQVGAWMDMMEEGLGVPVSYLGFGPLEEHTISRGALCR